jgi:hypothetical protein
MKRSEAISGKTWRQFTAWMVGSTGFEDVAPIHVANRKPTKHALKYHRYPKLIAHSFVILL